MCFFFFSLQECKMRPRRRSHKDQLAYGCHSLAGQTLAHEERVWYFTVSGFVLLSQLSQAAVRKLSIFLAVRGLLEINARAICSG